MWHTTLVYVFAGSYDRQNISKCPRIYDIDYGIDYYIHYDIHHDIDYAIEYAYTITYTMI